MPDIDIDFADRTLALDVFKHVTASNGDKKHNTGVYVHDIPYNPLRECVFFRRREASLPSLRSHDEATLVRGHACLLLN
jgi:hypothetical protein